MTQSTRRYNLRIILQALIFAVCCGFACWVRSVVAADTLDDLAAVALQAGALSAFVGAFAVFVATAWRARSLTERVAARVLPAALAVAATAFVASSYADASISLHALASTPGDGAGTIVALGPNGKDVRLSGELTDGAARSLAAVLDAHPDVERIHLTSEGGLVDEGEALRKVIAAHRLVTFVPDFCVSACTLAFLGGRERLVMEGARLGFHAPFEEGLFGQTFAGDKEGERAAYVATGVAPDFVDEAMKVGPEDIWTPDAETLMAAHVATGVVDRYRFPDSNLDGTPDLAGAKATILRNFPLARAIDAWRPQAVGIIAAWYLDAYRHSATEGQVVDGLKAVIGSAAATALAEADDDTMLGYGRFVETAMAAVDSDEECVAIGERPDLLQAEAALDQADGGADRLAVALLTRALQTRNAAVADAARERMRSSSQPAATSIALDDVSRDCAAIRGVYAAVLRLPKAAAAAALRSLALRREHVSPLAISVVDGRY